MASHQQHPHAQGPANSNWTEPPWSGWIESTGDALLILEAARRGLIPRVTRRLVESERKMITSGSVFVFDEDESGIKRWTDGFFWSPSRILGNFLLYRETEKRGAGHRTAARRDEHGERKTQSLSRSKSDLSGMSIDRQRERTLVGSLTDSYKFKNGGLMKKTFSLTINGVAQHLISYYTIEDVEGGRLRAPSTLPELSSLTISPEYLDKMHFRNPPKVEIGADGIPRYRGEGDQTDARPALVANGGGGSGGGSGGYDDEDDDDDKKRGDTRYEPYPRDRKSSSSSKRTKSAGDGGGGYNGGSSSSYNMGGTSSPVSSGAGGGHQYAPYPPAPSYYLQPYGSTPPLYAAPLPPLGPRSSSPISPHSPVSPVGSVSGVGGPQDRPGSTQLHPASFGAPSPASAYYSSSHSHGGHGGGHGGHHAQSPPMTHQQPPQQQSYYSLSTYASTNGGGGGGPQGPPSASPTRSSYGHSHGHGPSGATTTAPDGTIVMQYGLGGYASFAAPGGAGNGVNESPSPEMEHSHNPRRLLGGQMSAERSGGQDGEEDGEGEGDV